MKVWIKAIFLLGNKLGQLADAVQEELEKLSIDLTVETFRAFERMMALENKKRRLCNFKVLKDLLKAQLTADEKQVFKLRLEKSKSFDETADILQLHKSSVVRRFNKGMDKCLDFLNRLTYTEERFKSEYGDVEVICKSVSNS